MTRKPIKRVPITFLSENRINCGGWYAYAPTEQAPTRIRVRENERLLYCPYCGKWTIFKRKPTDMGVFKCTGWCGWSNTEDYYVNKFNRLWKMDMKKTNHTMVPKDVNMSPTIVGQRRRKR